MNDFTYYLDIYPNVLRQFYYVYRLHDLEMHKQNFSYS